jgi:hypothetical protein
VEKQGAGDGSSGYSKQQADAEFDGAGFTSVPGEDGCPSAGAIILETF